MHQGTPAEVATEESLNTRHGVERVIRDAFARAARRERRKVTMVHKTNVLTHAGGLWARTFAEVAAEYPDITTEYQHVDAAAMFLVTQPQRYDVDRHRQPLRRHPHRHRRRRHRRHRPGRQRLHQPRAAVPVDVRAGARLGAGHRGPGRRRPGRGRTLGRDHARPPRSPRGGPPREQAVAAELAGRTASATDGTPGRPAARPHEVGDRLASLAA